MTERTYTNRRYLDAVNDHVVIFDGAMGTSILKYDLTAADYGGEQYAGCVDYLVITRPDVIEAIHTSFLNVGSEAIETCTFRSNRLTLAEYGLQDRALEMNRAAAQLARRVCDKIAAETGIPLPTVSSWRRSPPVAMALADFVLVCRVIPDSLTSLCLEPSAKHIGTNGDDEGDLDAVAEHAGEFAHEYQKARHPASPGGVEIVPQEAARLHDIRLSLVADSRGRKAA